MFTNYARFPGPLYIYKATGNQMDRKSSEGFSNFAYQKCED